MRESPTLLAKSNVPSDGSFPLRFGDSIVISFTGNEGFLRVDSALSHNVVLDHLSPEAADSSITTYAMHECPFTLLPRTNSAERIQLIKALRSAGVKHEDLPQWKTHLADDDTRMPSLLAMERRAVEEEAAHRRDIEYFHGQKIRYGMQVQLRHGYSGGFLTTLSVGSDLSPLCMQLKLEPSPSQDSSFVIEPNSKQVQLGDILSNCATVMLRCARFDTLFISINEVQPLMEASGSLEGALHISVARRLEVCAGTQASSLMVQRYAAGEQHVHANTYQAVQDEEQVQGGTLLRDTGKQMQNKAGASTSGSDSHTDVRQGDVVRGGDIVSLYNSDGSSVLIVHGDGSQARVALMPLKGKQADPGSKGMFMMQRIAVADAGGQIGRLASDTMLLWHIASGMYLQWEGQGVSLSASAHYMGADGGSDKTCFLMQAVDTTCARASTHSGPLVFGDKVWISSGGWAGTRLHLGVGGAAVAKGDVELAPTTATRTPQLSDAFEVRRTDEWLARAVLRARSLAGALAAVAARVAQCSPFILPLNKDGTVNELDQNDYLGRHPSRKTLISQCERANVLITELLQLIPKPSLPPSSSLFTQTPTDSHLPTSPLSRDSASRDMDSSAAAARWRHVLRQQGCLKHVMSILMTSCVDLTIPSYYINNNTFVFGDVIWSLAVTCHRFFQHMCIDNEANRRMLVPHLPKLVRLLEHVKLEAEDAITEVLKCKADILATLPDDFFNLLIRYLRQRRLPRYTRVLAAACTCADDSAVKANQDRALQYFFVEAPELICAVRYSLPVTEVETFTADMWLSDRAANKYNLFEVSCLAMAADDDDQLLRGAEHNSDQQLLFQYYLSTLHLMACVVKGRNRNASTLLMQQSDEFACTYNDLLFVIKHEKMPHVLRALACNLMHHLYIDREPHDLVHVIQRTRVWSKLHDSVPDEKPQRPDPFVGIEYAARPPTGFKDLTDAVTTGVTDYHRVDTRMTARTFATLSFVKLCNSLARYGAFHTYDAVRRVTVPDFDFAAGFLNVLCELLDGRSDIIHFPDGKDDPQEWMDEAIANPKRLCRDRLRLLRESTQGDLADLKLATCALIGFFWDCRSDVRLTMLLDMYEEIVEDKIGPSLFASVTQGGGGGGGGKSDKDKFKSVAPDAAADGDQEAANDELDLPMKYARDTQQWYHRPLWNTSTLFNLAEQLFNRENFGRPFVAPDPESEPLGSLVPCTRVLLDLAQYEDQRLVEAALRLLMRHFNQRTHFVHMAMHTHLIVRPTTARVFYQMRCEVAELRSWLPYLDEDADARRKKDALTQCTKLVQRFINVLTPSIAGNERGGSDVKEAQTMAINLKMHTALLLILSLPLKRQLARRVGDLDVALDADRRDLFVPCHQLLQRLCSENQEMQDYFFEHRTLLIKQIGIAGLDMEHSLAAVVEGNRALVDKVGEEWIGLLFRTMMQYQTRRARWLDAIRPLVWPKGEAGGVKEHQAMVMRAFAMNPGQYLSLMADDEDWNMRIDLILSDERQVKGSSSQLAYHVSCIRLLAACAKGSSPSVVSQVMSLLPLSAIMDVLLSIDVRRGMHQTDSLPITTTRWVKGAFLCVLHEAYMQSVRPEARAAVAHVGNRLWQQPSEGLYSKEGDAGAQESLMQSMLDDAKELLVALEYQSKGHAIQQAAEFKSLMTYVLEDTVPMLEAYYRNHYSAKSSNDQASRVQITETLFDTLSSMLVHLEQYPQYRSDTIKVLGAIGSKLPSREAQLRMLELKDGSESALVDAPSLLRDLMRVGFSVLCAQFSAVIGIPDVRSLPSHGAQLNLSLMLSQDCNAPLHDEQMEAALTTWWRRINPPFRVYAMRLCELLEAGVGQKHEEGHDAGASMTFAMEGVRILRGMLHVEDPTSTYVPASTGNPHDVARYQKDLDRRWDAFLTCNVPVKGVPRTACLAWVQDKSRVVGAVDAAVKLCESDDVSVRVEAWTLLRDLLHGENAHVKQHMLRRSVALRLRASMVNALHAAETELVKYRRGRKKLLAHVRKTLAESSANSVRAAAQHDDLHVYYALGPRGEAGMAMTVAVQLMNTNNAQVLNGEGGVVEAAARLMIRLHNVLTLSINDGDTCPLRLARLACLVMTAGSTGQCCERNAVFTSKDTSECARFARAIEWCVESLHYRSHAPLLMEGDTAVAADALMLHDGSHLNEALCDFRSALLGFCLTCAPHEIAPISADVFITHAVRLSKLLCIEPKEARQPLDEDAQQSKRKEEADFVGQALDDGAVGVFAKPDDTLSGMGMSAWHTSRGLPDEMLHSIFVAQRVERIQGKTSQASKASSAADVLQALAAKHSWLAAYMERHVRCVELRGSDGDLERVYFRVEHNVLTMWSSTRAAHKQRKQLLGYEVQGDAVQRARAFVGRMQEEYCKVQTIRAWNSSALVTSAVMYRGVVDAIPRALSVVCMLLLVIFYGVPTSVGSDALFGGSFTVTANGYQGADAASALATAGSRWRDDPAWMYAPWLRPLLRFVCVVHLFASLAAASVYFLIFWPNAFIQVCGTVRRERIASARAAKKERDALPRTGISYLKHIPPPPTTGALQMDAYMVLRFLTSSVEPYYWMLFLLLSLLALANNPFFLLAHLLDFLRGATGRHLAQAARICGVRLLRTFAYSLLVVICFGFYAYSYFITDMHATNQRACHSPWQCVSLLILDAVARNPALTHDDIYFGQTPTLIGSDTWAQHRSLYAVAFMIIWGFLLQGAILAQIVDAFVELRDKDKSIQSQMHSQCFVCGMERHLFAHVQGGFERHVTQYHDPVNYLAFIDHVASKPQAERTPLERHVVASFHQGSIDFLPIGQALDIVEGDGKPL